VIAIGPPAADTQTPGVLSSLFLTALPIRRTSRRRDVSSRTTNTAISHPNAMLSSEHRHFQEHEALGSRAGKEFFHMKRRGKVLVLKEFWRN
jgi:hypothetical protein